MSIRVHCEECGKSFQVRDELAGRKGRCPKGHPIEVPLADDSAEVAPAPQAPQAAQEDFAFLGDSRFDNPATDPEPAPVLARLEKPGKRRSARAKAEPEPAPQPAAPADDFAFPTPSLIGNNDRDEEPAPKTGKYGKPAAKAAGRDAKATGKPNMMPLYLGALLAVLGIGGGVTMLVMSRGEAAPLREAADAANKKAAAAEERAAKSDALKVVAETDLEKFKKNPPPNPALAETQAKLKAAEKRAKEAEDKLKELLATAKPGPGGEAAMPAKAADLDPSGPGGKDDPVMPGGKLDRNPAKKGPAGKADPKMEAGNPGAAAGDGPPLGGKNWTVPGTIMLGKTNFKGGDILWLSPQEDVPLKVEGGKLTIKFKWQQRKGKELPAAVGVALMVQETRQIQTQARLMDIKGPTGEAEVTFDAKDYKGKLPIYFYIGNGKAMGPVAYSTLISYQVDFGAEPK